MWQPLSPENCHDPHGPFPSLQHCERTEWNERQRSWFDYHFGVLGWPGIRTGVSLGFDGFDGGFAGMIVYLIWI
jgi:hypothetical protein